jgi:hypothetical protein
MTSAVFLEPLFLLSHSPGLVLNLGRHPHSHKITAQFQASHPTVSNPEEKGTLRSYDVFLRKCLP